jgi:hypothetical protein
MFNSPPPVINAITTVEADEERVPRTKRSHSKAKWKLILYSGDKPFSVVPKKFSIC